MVELPLGGLEVGVASPRVVGAAAGAPVGTPVVARPALVRDELELRTEPVGVAMEKLKSMALGSCGTFRCEVGMDVSDVEDRRGPAPELSPEACKIDAESPPRAEVDLKPPIEGIGILAFRSTLEAGLGWRLP